jgi:hypothetical protein
LLAVGVVAGSWRVSTWLSYYLRMAALTFLAISVVGVFVYGFVCPRCRASLLFKSVTVFDGRPVACPKCGVSMDDPRDSPANRK